jgi:N-acetylglucosaminyl-diphospho-decaprenol L-rhamnosyltransferase
MPFKPEVSFSIVSHGQGKLVTRLLADIRQGVDVSYEIIITLNIMEDEAFLEEFKDLKLVIIRNSHRKGFGENHNSAFNRARGIFFAVLNPDIRANPLRLRPLLNLMADRTVGACSPAVYSPDGKFEDSARCFPTLKIFFLRKIGMLRNSDYVIEQSPIDVDWVAGMFMLFRSEVFAQVGGFDIRYFMYLEDTDICRRLRNKGLRIVLHPASSVVHDARRASRKSFQHFAWHLSSALRYLGTNYRSE